MKSKKKNECVGNSICLLTRTTLAATMSCGVYYVYRLKYMIIASKVGVE